MEDNKLIADKLKFWRQCLRQALKSNDISYAMHCDEMIVNLKTKENV